MFLFGVAASELTAIGSSFSGTFALEPVALEGSVGRVVGACVNSTHSPLEHVIGLGICAFGESGDLELKAWLKELTDHF